MRKATDLILNQMCQFFPVCRSFEIKDYLSGMRVVNGVGSYPRMKKLSETLYVITEMGARGPLYHALFGKLLAEEILP